LRRRITIAALPFALTVGLFLVGERAAHADRIDDLAKTIATDPSWRVRLQAVVVLGKMTDRRAIPPLSRALHDQNETVRALAAQALGEIGGPEFPEARDVLRAAQRDPSKFVRDKVTAALAQIDRASAPSPFATTTEPAAAAKRGEVHVAVGGIGAKTRNTPPELTLRLRDFILRELKRTPGLTIEGRPLDDVSGFYIDSAITALTRKTTDQFVEISCEVSYIVGRMPSKAMVMMTSGGATVQTPRGMFKAQEERRMQVDALEGAVRGAHENLVAFLKTQKK
jgi:hypothetical protein